MRRLSRTVMIGVLGLSAALLLGRLAAVHAEPGAQDPVSNEECLACHGAPGVTWTLPSGEVRSATIDPEGYRTSVHGKDQIPCTDCHGQTGGYPHPTPEAPTSREFRVRSSEACRTCHGEKFELVQDSVHQRALEAGNLDAPVCVDCHGAHEIRPPASNLVFAAAACGQCHVEIYGDYLESVHGSALLEENPDVPTCTTCHSVHSIQSPATVQFRAQSPELCGSCHTDETRMAKYGLSTDVYETYLDDFHGKTVLLKRAGGGLEEVQAAVCYDCHGVHEIRSVTDPEATAMRENLVSTCQRCHPGITASFPAAWLSHRQPSLSQASAVFYTEIFFTALTVAVIVGLIAHIALELLRAARSSLRTNAGVSQGERREEE